MDQSERVRVSESRHAERGGGALHLRAGEGSVHANMSVTERWGEKNGREGERGDLKKKRLVGKEGGAGAF